MIINKPVCFVFYPLQSLSMLLNGTPFAFVIDLAALASRREYLKLDKWLTDKIREHGVSLQIDSRAVALKKCSPLYFEPTTRGILYFTIILCCVRNLLSRRV